jgi:hypothetical protein
MNPKRKGSRNHPTPNTDLTAKAAHGKDRYLTLTYIVKQVENGTGLPLHELKLKYTEDRLFSVALRFVTTTKKALCTALGIPVEGACRYKRNLEKEGRLVQSADALFVR